MFIRRRFDIYLFTYFIFFYSYFFFTTSTAYLFRLSHIYDFVFRTYNIINKVRLNSVTTVSKHRITTGKIKR